MDDFPSSVSCVSELITESDTVMDEEHPKTPLPPSLYPVLVKVAPEFQKRFPGFRPSSPLYNVKPDGIEVLTISFLYKEHDIPRFATLVYEVKAHTSTSWSAQFNPFRSSPQPHQMNGIDWIKLYHIDFEPGLYALEKALEEFYNLNISPQRLADGPV